jgi:hypothetical protein
MKKSLFALAFLASTLSGAASFGQTDETRIRSDAGGLYQSPAFGNGSVTGLPSTKVIFRDAAGKVLDERDRSGLESARRSRYCSASHREYDPTCKRTKNAPI